MSSVEEKIDIPTLIKTMGKFQKELFFHRCNVNKPDLDKEESLKKQLDKISIRIRSLLPKDPDLSEIDDIFIPPTNQEAVLEAYAGEHMSLYLNRFMVFYGSMVKEMYTAFLDPVNISTFTELVLLGPCTEPGLNLIQCHIKGLSFVFPFQKLLGTWLVLKAWRVLCMKCKAYLSTSEYLGKLRNLIPWLMRLKDIPEAKSKEKQRLTTWISRQAAAILESLDCSFIYNDKHNFSLWTGDHESYVYNLMQHKAPIIEVIDYLHAYFMSSNDENQRIQLIESFIRGCLKAYESENSNQYKQLHDHDCYRLPEKILFLKYFGILTMEFYDYILDSHDPERFPEDQWNEIEKYYGNKFEPYLAENRCNSSIVHELSCQRINEKAKNTLDSENDGEPPEDLAIEKYIFFDGFLNRLRVMSILREALWKTADILEMDQFPEDYETLVFRTFALSRLRSGFPSALKRDTFVQSRTRIYFAMRMCPFLFLSKHHEYLMEDLFKCLSGEVVDEATLDELYFAINCIPGFKY